MSALEELAAIVARELGPAARFGWAVADADPVLLHPAEHLAIASAVEKRKREFAAGRLLARSLLGELGHATASLPADTHRRPIWPPGTLGSISHADGTVAVIVARADGLAAVGLDLERDEPLEPELWPEIATERELAELLLEPDARAAGRRALRTFSAKECVYKAQHPLTDLPLGFQDIEVTLDPSGATFAARRAGKHTLPRAPRWTGQIVADSHWLVSAVWIYHSSATAR